MVFLKTSPCWLIFFFTLVQSKNQMGAVVSLLLESYF